jgi:hypothetical protein
MAPVNNILFALHPVILVSCFTGMLPLKFTVRGSHNLEIQRDRKLFICSVIYFIVQWIRDINYFLKLAWHHFNSESYDMEVVHFLQLFGASIFNIYILLIFYFMVFDSKKFIIIIQELTKMDSIVPHRNIQSVRHIILFYFICIHGLYLSFHIVNLYSAVKDGNYEYINIFTGIMIYIAGCNHITIEMHFWSICYLLYRYLEQMNYCLKCHAQNTKNLTMKRIDDYRKVFEIVHKLHLLTNLMYDRCLMCFLCMRNVYTQYDLYLLVKNIFDLVVLNEPIEDVYYSVKWLIFAGIRVFLLFSICTNVENEVINIIITIYYRGSGKKDVM